MDKEILKYDCFRGCEIRPLTDGGVEYPYKAGCCKMEVFNYLAGIHPFPASDLFEVRFKNTRKGIYRNDSGQSIKTGDKVVVEAVTGQDLGIVTLEGPIVERQMKAKGLNPAEFEFRKIYRKAKPQDIERWREAVSREQQTMIRARQLAANLSLEMKIGDVEFLGDGSKAIFYYIADGRVDFRQLIKDFAEEFHIRVEMKQIGARQEAGLIGGLGVCGRELCCSNYISTFKSIGTSAARCQDLSQNPQKLAGQCGKLKCCLNYEVAAYTDALSRIPKLHQPLEFQDGLAYLAKTDILSETMYFTYEKGSLASLYPLPAAQVKEIIEMNARGEKPETIKSEPVNEEIDFVSDVAEDSISRFDPAKGGRKKHGSRHNHGKGGQGGQGGHGGHGGHGAQGGQGGHGGRHGRNGSGGASGGSSAK